MKRHSVAAWIIVSVLLLSVSSVQSDPAYPTSQRIQIPESCSVVAKWLTQSLSSGPHWQMLSYEPDLGLLTFKVVSMDHMSKAEVRQYISPEDVKKGKTASAKTITFTLRSLVGSSVSFDGAPPVTSDSCTIAAGIKFVAKDGTPLGSSGAVEQQLLETVKTRYAEHGLDY